MATARSEPWKPTKQQLVAAAGSRVRDLIAPDLAVLFCGINPGLYSAAVGHHFARPGNRFWKTLHLAGFTERQLSPFEEHELLERGVGITNIVHRATASASELSVEELRAGALRLERKVRRYRPAWIAFAGIGAYRKAFGRRLAVLGRQPDTIGHTSLWVVPNPSGAQARYQLPELVDAFRDLHGAAFDATS